MPRFLVILLIGGCELVFPLRDRPPADTADAAVVFPDGPADHDEDGDGLIDSEDNCPGIGNAAQLDGDRDGVGNDCDPRPIAEGDVLVHFDPFTVFDGNRWIVDAGTWRVEADQMRQIDDAPGNYLLRLATESPLTSPTIEVIVAEIGGPDPTDVGAVLKIGGTGGLPAGTFGYFDARNRQIVLFENRTGLEPLGPGAAVLLEGIAFPIRLGLHAAGGPSGGPFLNAVRPNAVAAIASHNNPPTPDVEQAEVGIYVFNATAAIASVSVYAVED